MDSLRFCTLLIKQIIKATIGIEVSDKEALVHAQELENQLREEYTEAGGISESGFLEYIREKVNKGLEITTD